MSGVLESEVPFLRPIMGQELSSVQFRQLDEQLFRAMAALHDQKQRHGVARLVGMKAPVTIVTPTVDRMPTTPEMKKEFLDRVYRKLPFALPSDQAEKQIRDRENEFRQAFFTAVGEPLTAKRVIKAPVATSAPAEAPKGSDVQKGETKHATKPQSP